jgi:hypothetical protein
VTPTPLPYRDWIPAQGIRPLTEPQAVQLADRLPVTPYFVLPSGYLRHGFARAFVSGQPDDPDAVVVQSLAAPDELEFFGNDPEAGWELLSRIPGWSCVNGPTPDIRALLPILEREVGLPYRSLGDLFFSLEEPPHPHSDPSVRRLSIADIPLLLRAAPEIRAGGYRSYEEALSEGVIAAAIIDERIVALADNSASNSRYSDVGVHTLEPYRRRGLSSAAATLVAREVQARGHIPTWSTGGDNIASQRVAAKLGFRPVGRAEYVIFDALKERGGYRPA